MALTRRPLVTFLRLDQSYEAKIRKILRESAADAERDILRASTRPLNPISQAQLIAQRAALRARLNQDWSDIGKAIAAGRKDAALLAGKTATEMQSPLLRQIMPDSAVNALAVSEGQRAADGLENVVARLTSSYKPLSERVYNNAALSGGRVDRLVNSALARGLSARDFAREARAFISPDVPGGVSYAAMRLARTEINNSFHASTVQRYSENETIARVDWNLSGSHKHLDVCDVLASKSYDPKRVPEKPHPQCFCFITPQLLRPDDFLHLMESGAYDEKPWWQDVLGVAVGGAVLSTGIEEFAQSAAFRIISAEARLARTKTTVTALRAFRSAPTARELLALERGANRLELAAAPTLRELPLPTTDYLANLASSLQKLQQGYKSGYQILREIGDGSSKVNLVELKDGSRAAIKYGNGSYLSEEAQREALGYRLMKAMDLEANPTFADGNLTVSRFIDNALNGDEYFKELGRAVTDGVEFTKDVAAARDALYKSRVVQLVGAREMGLFDWLVQNADRHGGNFFVKDGRIIPLDQGAIFDHRRNSLGELDFSLSFPNEFTEYALDFDNAGRVVGSSRYTAAELRRIRDRIVRTRAEFEKVGQAGWFKDVIDTLDDVIDRVVRGEAATALKARSVRALETASAVKYRNDILDLQDSLAAGEYERLYDGIKLGINETYKIRFADGTYGIEKNIPMDEITQEIGSMRVLRETLGVDEMPATVVRNGNSVNRMRWESVLDNYEAQGIRIDLDDADPSGSPTYFFITSTGERLRHLTRPDLERAVRRDLVDQDLDPYENVRVAGNYSKPQMIQRFAPTPSGMNGADWMGQYAYNTTRLVNEVKNAREVGLFDFISQNTDRHGGNWLYDDVANTLIPIDHGFTFSNGYWTGASANYDFYKGWVATTLDVSDKGIPDVLSRNFSMLTGKFAGPDMKFTLRELEEFQRKLQAQKAFFTAASHPAWYKTMQYNLSDLVERKRIYESEGIKNVSDMKAYLRRRKAEALGRQYDQEKFEQAVQDNMRLLAEAQWRGMEIGELMARGKLGLLPRLRGADLADFEAAVKPPIHDKFLRAQAEDLIDNPRELQDAIDAYDDRIEVLQKTLAINKLDFVPESRLKEWAVDNGVDADTAADFQQAIAENVTAEGVLGYTPAQLRDRLEQYLEQVREMLDEAPYEVQVVPGLKKVEVIRHVEKAVPDYVMDRQTQLALDEYGTYIGWNVRLRNGFNPAERLIPDFERRTQMIDQAIWNNTLSKPATFFRVEGDLEARARWAKVIEEGVHADKGFISVVQRNGLDFEQQKDLLEQLEPFADDAPLTVMIRYELYEGDHALNMRNIGFDAYIDGEFLLERDAYWEVQGYEFDKTAWDTDILYITLAREF